MREIGIKLLQKQTIGKTKDQGMVILPHQGDRFSSKNKTVSVVITNRIYENGSPDPYHNAVWYTFDLEDELIHTSEQNP